MTSRPRRLTVATYNLYLGADLAPLFGVTTADELATQVEVVRDQLARTDFGPRAAVIARILAREQVDVVGLQEVSRWVGAAQWTADFLPVLLAALEAAGTPYDVHALNPSFAGGLPLDGGWMSVEGANATLVRRGGPFRVTGERTGMFARGHTVRIGPEGFELPIARGWGVVDGEVGGVRVVVANVHTEAYHAATRDAQRDELLALLADEDCPVVVCGDLNATPSEVGVPAPYVDAWTAAGNDPEAGHTCGQAADLANPDSELHARIDYVFVRDADVLDCRVVGADEDDRTTPGRLWPSDHAGVVARLGF